MTPRKVKGPRADGRPSQLRAAVAGFPYCGSAGRTERVQRTGGGDARARPTPRPRRAGEREGQLSARPPPVCGARPMRSDRGRSFVVEPRPPGASRPRPCPPPPALRCSQGAPRGLLKRHALSALGTPQRRLLPGGGRGVDPGGGGADPELGRARRRSEAAGASPERVSMSEGYSWRESLAGGEGGDRFRIFRVAVAEPWVRCGAAGQDRRRGRPRRSLWPPRDRSEVQFLWPGGPQMQPLHRRHQVSWANNPGKSVPNSLGLKPLGQLRTYPREMCKLHTV